MTVNILQTNKPRVVIIGGGFAGIEFAKALPHDEFQIVMLDKNNYHTFIPLLYQVATAGLEPDSIAFPIRKIFKGQHNFIFRMAEAYKINPENRYIETSIGNISYDYLVIATGSKTNFYNLHDFEAKALPMKSIIEALNLRSAILQKFEEALLTDDIKERESFMTMIIVGGGPQGVEIAGALAELKKHILPSDYYELDTRKMQIHLIEILPRLIATMSESSSVKAKEFLEKLGVTVWLSTGVKSYDGLVVTLSNGNVINSKTVIWSAGVMGATIEGINGKKLIKGNRIKVDAFNRADGFDNIFAIGDVAGMISDKFPLGHPMLAPVAIQQGINLARNLVNLINNRELVPFEYKDPGTMATVGRNRAVVDLQYLNIQGFVAWLIWVFVHLMKLVGFRNRLVVFVNWVWNYFSYDRGIRLIIRPFNKS